MADFRVEAVDLNNRHLTLENVGEGAPTSINAGLRRADANAAANDTPESPVVPQDLTLARPHSAQGSASQVRLDAPALAENTPLSAISFDSRTPAPAAPPEPAPAPMEAFPSANGPSVNSANTSGSNANSPSASSPSANTGRGGFRQAVVIHIVQPSYSREATKDHVTGDVRVSALVDKDGVPRDVKVISGDKRLSAAALAAVKQWRYDPAQLNGEPVQSSVVVTVNFQPR
jgi:TonB family protein